MRSQEIRPERQDALPIPDVVGSHGANQMRDRMEASCHIDALHPLAEALERRVVGQEDAIEPLICSFSRLLSGLNDPSRPLLTALLLGPTGVGKTETARSVAQALFGADRDLTRVNCEEYSHGHELSKLLGSPPGYVGFDIEPLLSQSRIDGPHRALRDDSQSQQGEVRSLAEQIFPASEGHYLSVILFDEILVYSPLEHQHLERVFDKFLVDIHDRALGQAGVPLLLRVAPQAKDHIIAQGTDLRFGARPLRRAIEHQLVDPLSRFIASQMLRAGDVVEVELEREQLAFYRS